MGVLSCSVFAQKRGKNAPVEEVVPPRPFVEQLRDDYQNFYNNGGVFEKLYLMTDKPYYSAGESMYFSGFLVQASLMTRISSSSFIYVELISPDGRVVERQKLYAPSDARQFIGNINLSARLTSGKYTLRAYTRWMTNFDKGYFFSKQIFIGNYIDDAILTKVTYDINAKGQVIANVSFTDQFGIPIASTPVKYKTIIDGKISNSSERTDKEGTIHIKFKPSEHPNDCLELTIRANSRELSRYVALPAFSNDYDVQFCPEGGDLISNMVQVVAFKAQMLNGHSLELTGNVYDDQGNFISEIHTEHQGMGHFVIRPLAGQKYYVDFVSKDGLKKRFFMPEVKTEGVSVRVMRHVGSHTFLFYATPGIDLHDYVAVLHSRGAVMTVLEDITHPLTVKNDVMFDGIGQISLVHKIARKVVSSRLFYVRDNRFAKAEFQYNKPEFEQRDRVALSINVVDSDGKPVKGNFALSVTDSSVVLQSESKENILSYMLLTSDLKGEIENPASYFEEDETMLDKLDLVMLTNGWRRYSMQDILNGVMPRIMYPMEDSQRIMGSVFGLFGRAKKPSIVVMDPKTRYVEQFELNEANNFIISGLDAYSTASYIVQALNKKGKDRTVRIKIETENYPLISTNTHRDYYKNPVRVIPETFLTRAREKYFNEGGERVIDIEEIVVTAKKKNMPFFAMGNTGSLLNGDLTRFANVFEALTTFKELDVIGNEIHTLPRYVNKNLLEDEGISEGTDINDESATDVQTIQVANFANNDALVPDLYINGNISDISNIDNYDIKYVERLAFVDGKAAYMLGLHAPAGAILMEVSQEGLSQAVTSDAMARVLVKACNKPDAFFKPKYVTAESRVTGQPDNRSTITWEPYIRTDDNGNALVWFYTADRDSTYDVVMEGITDDGELLRKVDQIKVNFKPLI